MDVIVYIIAIIAIVLFLRLRYVRRALENNELQLLYANARITESTKEITEIKSELASTLEAFSKAVEEKDQFYERITEDPTATFTYCASMMADHLTLQYLISEKYLKSKSHPAHKEAKRIRELREETQKIIHESKLIAYKYDYLLGLFPDLEMYINDTESMKELANFKNINKLENESDRTLRYLTREEYKSLSTAERNQLALERYIKSQKTKWQIGRDYEMCIGYEYSKSGWDVQYVGIDKQLEDMGRDLIASKGNEVHIVQCKYWSQEKLIHEKHISQLYGTTVHYLLTSGSNRTIVPVIITNIKLSDTAKDFADYLKVKVLENIPMSDFPRIKCNINVDEFGLESRIYHLPMDQQYDKTKINKKGEFFAFSVEEAELSGFRRAMKWLGS